MATHLSLVSIVHEHVALRSWVIHLCVAVRTTNVLALKWSAFLAMFDQQMMGVENAFVRPVNGFVHRRDAHRPAKKVSNVCLTLTHVVVSGVVNDQANCPQMTSPAPETVHKKRLCRLFVCARVMAVGWHQCVFMAKP